MRIYLDPWNKVRVMAGAAAAVTITILMVVCFVGEGCIFHDLITNSNSKFKKLNNILLKKLSRKEKRSTKAVMSPVRAGG